MGLQTVSFVNENLEADIQKRINKCLVENASFVFNAGAGSGKTYSLIESIRNVIRTRGNELINCNQKVICITYTNVATNEIKKRIGNTDLVLISTIHERLWQLIKDYKKELLLIHISNLKSKTIELSSQMENDDNFANQFQYYRSLSETDKLEFAEKMYENRDLFYTNYSKSAKEFKAIFSVSSSLIQGALSNVANFKKTVSTLYKIRDYTECLKRIEAHENKYSSIRYESRFNTDSLHKMRISHDTLIEYALLLITKYDLLKQIIIDKFPYIFIDEYQDTNEKVVLIMKEVAMYSTQIHHNICIGYFGDTAQNIYDDGVGRNLCKLHSGLVTITKQFNRRSYQEVIDIINLIRDDDVKQESIYEDCMGGSVKFYCSKNTDTRAFINKYIQQWSITKDNKLHCLLLTNRLVSEYSGFSTLYQCFSETAYYKNYYDQINTEILSNDINKLGEIPLVFHNYLTFLNDFQSKSTSISSIIDKCESKDVSIFRMNSIIQELKGINGQTLHELIKSLLDLYQSTDSEIKKVIKKYINCEYLSYDLFIQYIMDKLYPNIEETAIADAMMNVIRLLDITIEEYQRWYDFIAKKESSDVVYHTYHGTKGEEYNNVLIIMENDFGLRNKGKFSSYFSSRSRKSTLSEQDKKKYDDTSNLLYVSCSRAIQNLRILYLDDISDFESGIKDIFGVVYS